MLSRRGATIGAESSAGVSKPSGNVPGTAGRTMSLNYSHDRWGCHCPTIGLQPRIRLSSYGATRTPKANLPNWTNSSQRTRRGRSLSWCNLTRPDATNHALATTNQKVSAAHLASSCRTRFAPFDLPKLSVYNHHAYTRDRSCGTRPH
jgi:hypothetical protein